MSASGVVHVIDDDKAVRESLEFRLRSTGLEVRTCESATVFVANLPQSEGGCIITDVRMPGISGVELLNRLREIGVAMPVILVTGHGDVQLAVNAMKGGAIDFLEKPFDDDILLNCVRSALATREAEDQHSVQIKEVGQRLEALSNRERSRAWSLVSRTRLSLSTSALARAPSKSTGPT